MEFYRHRALGRRNGGSGTVLAAYVREGNTLFTRWGLRQRSCGPVVGGAGLAHQRNPRISRICSCAFGLAGHAGLSALQPCHLCVWDSLQRVVLGLLRDAESVPLRYNIQPSVYSPRANRPSLWSSRAAKDDRHRVPRACHPDCCLRFAPGHSRDPGRANSPGCHRREPTVNFVHVLDLGFLLPALCITAILLFRRKAAGYALAPVFLTLLAIMSMELVSILTVMGRAGFGMSCPMIIFFVVLAVGFTILLWLYFSLAKRAA